MRRPLAVFVAAITLLVISAPTAAAHTGFDRSEPSDGSTVDTPVASIDLIFTGAVEPAGEGFVVLDPSGAVRAADSITRPDETTYRLGFDPPLTGGTVGVRWTIASADGHPISDGFSFTVTAPTPTTTTTTSPSTTSAPGTTTSPGPAEPDVGQPRDPAAEPIDLQTFLDESDTTAAGVEAVTAVIRSLMFAALLLGIGALAFAQFSARDDAEDTAMLLRWTGACGPVVVVGALALVAVRVAELYGEWSAIWDADALWETVNGSYGIATALRVVAGGLWWAAAWMVARDITRSGSAPATVPPAASIGALAGVLSFSFVGHTVSEGPRWLHSLVDVVHVAAAGVWVGGVAALAMVARRRARESRAVAPVAARFSVSATIALVAVSLAGIALGVIIADEPADLWSTGWGRLLLVKVGVVVVAAIGGGYNHRVIVPALADGDESSQTAARFRRVMSLELCCFAAVIVLTALMVAASP